MRFGYGQGHWFLSASLAFGCFWAQALRSWGASWLREWWRKGCAWAWTIRIRSRTMPERYGICNWFDCFDCFNSTRLPRFIGKLLIFARHARFVRQDHQLYGCVPWIQNPNVIGMIYGHSWKLFKHIQTIEEDQTGRRIKRCNRTLTCKLNQGSRQAADRESWRSVVWSKIFSGLILNMWYIWTIGVFLPTLQGQWLPWMGQGVEGTFCLRGEQNIFAAGQMVSVCEAVKHFMVFLFHCLEVQIVNHCWIEIWWNLCIQVYSTRYSQFKHVQTC